MKVSWPYFDPEYDTLQERIYGPKASIDNESMRDCTVIKVDGVNKQGLLLEVVQILTDANLSISKSYISADGRWFMDVFHVKDEKGNKITDQEVIDYIQQEIGGCTSFDGLNVMTDRAMMSSQTDKVARSRKPNCDHTTIEMTGDDRPGLFSEISAALFDLQCRIIEAHVWTHNSQLACVAHVSDQKTDGQIQELERLAAIKDSLTSITLNAKTKGYSFSVIPMVNRQAARSPPFQRGQVECSGTDLERRLHRLMLPARDSNMSSFSSSTDAINETEHVSVEDCNEKGYLIVSIKCKDRLRLMFDCVCTLTDMQYVIFHASGSLDDGYAYQEYFVRNMNGSAFSMDSEKAKIVKCMKAALKRRNPKGIRLELRARNREGLLSDITRALRRNGLDVVRAQVATRGDDSVNSFDVRGILDEPVKVTDIGFVESLQKETGPLKIAYRSI